jgi:hypothetical protein
MVFLPLDTGSQDPVSWFSEHAKAISVLPQFPPPSDYHVLVRCGDPADDSPVLMVVTDARQIDKLPVQLTTRYLWGWVVRTYVVRVCEDLRGATFWYHSNP